MERHHPPSNGDETQSVPMAHPQSLSIELDYDRRINYAMQQNDVPVVKLLRISNPGADPLEDLVLTVWIDHDLAPAVQHHIARIGGGETWNLEKLDLPLDPAVLLRQEEREVSTLHVEVRRGDDVLCRERLSVEILAYNEWGGLSTLPEILAAFVMPNQPAVERILGRMRDVLKEQTGDGSLSGYQQQSRTAYASWRTPATWRSRSWRSVTSTRPQASRATDRRSERPARSWRCGWAPVWIWPC